MIRYSVTVRLTRSHDLKVIADAEDVETAEEQVKKRAEHYNPGYTAEVIDIKESDKVE